MVCHLHVQLYNGNPQRNPQRTSKENVFYNKILSEQILTLNIYLSKNQYRSIFIDLSFDFRWTIVIIILLSLALIGVIILSIRSRYKRQKAQKTGKLKIKRIYDDCSKFASTMIHGKPITALYNNFILSSNGNTFFRVDQRKKYEAHKNIFNNLTTWFRFHKAFWVI